MQQEKEGPKRGKEDTRASERASDLYSTRLPSDPRKLSSLENPAGEQGLSSRVQNSGAGRVEGLELFKAIGICSSLGLTGALLPWGLPPSPESPLALIDRLPQSKLQPSWRPHSFSYKQG